MSIELISKGNKMVFDSESGTITEYFGGGISNILPNIFEDEDSAQEWVFEREECASEVEQKHLFFHGI